MKRFAIKVRIQSDYLYEVDAGTQEQAEERAMQMAHDEMDNGDIDTETYSAAVHLTGDQTSMFDTKVNEQLAQLIHEQI